MKTLSETWFAEGYIDFELKKYTLLAYLQEVGKYFNEHKLYPQLADVIFHYNNIVSFRENKKFLQEHFPKQLTEINIKKLQLVYERMIEDDELMKELEEIIQFSATRIKGTIQNGAEIYEYVETKLIIAPVGLVPLDTNEGYLMLRDVKGNATTVYHYRLSIFEKHDEKYRGIHTHYIQQWQRSVSNSPESIKAELIRNRKELPNPAVYHIDTDLAYPLEETLLPIAKRSFVKFISK
ncbi:hypothetical protein EXU57_03905 [Segetibacter sp. 3557_3]|uniref:hypothetical protein n=1 Tax=Segetibacter sp. 3557_3 TaxID=2547429 RepID=UPI0010584B18|nr:hypothetical protein [Segetibacter sp. 3557_3]TDH29221.1 hypothetical protein EXU57_03905 [Segetibacter sp. 3557_3]